MINIFKNLYPKDINYNNSTYISTSYIKWLAWAGIRVIVVPVWEPIEKIKEILKNVNAV